MKSLAAARAVALLATLGLLGTAPAIAGVAQGDVVQDQPDPSVAQLVATKAFSMPRVDALARKRSTLYFGGAFNRVVDAGGPQGRSYLAALDVRSGQLRSFAPQLDGPVSALAAHRKALYVGGSFTTVDGKSHPGLVKLHTKTGKPFKRFSFPLGRTVTDLAISHGQLVVGGSFPGQLRSVDLRTGRPTTFVSPRIRGKVARKAGITEVSRFAVDPTQTRLVAVGNFNRVDGVQRRRAFMLNLRADRTSKLAKWYYAPLKKRSCRSVKWYKLPNISDVDFSPDGSYFVLGATGGPVRFASDIGTAVCDGVARFESDVRKPAAPTWVNYTGGDTVWSVLASGAAVYVQGHFRWLDNPEGRDSAGPGAVKRRGIGAIDPTTGKALDWNPDKPARRGGRALVDDDRGLWIGSDSETLAGKPHLGLGFLPLPPNS